MGKTLAYGSRKCRHSYVANIGGESSMGQTARLDHWGTIFCGSVWDPDGDLALAAVKCPDLYPMIAADAEICRLWWYDRFGIYGKQEFARADSRLKCDAV